MPPNWRQKPGERRFVSRTPAKRLMESLVHQGLISPEDREPLTEATRLTGQTLSSLLLTLRMVDEGILAQTLVHVCDLPYLDVSAYTIDTDVLKLIDAEPCWERKMLPLERVGSTLTLAMVDPLDDISATRISADTQLGITRVVTRAGDLAQALKNHWPQYQKPPQKFGLEQAVSALDEARSSLARAGARADLPAAGLRQAGAPTTAESDQDTTDLGWLSTLGSAPGAISSSGSLNEGDLSDLPDWLDAEPEVAPAEQSPPPSSPPTKSPASPVPENPSPTMKPVPLPSSSSAVRKTPIPVKSSSLPEWVSHAREAKPAVESPSSRDPEAKAPEQEKKKEDDVERSQNGNTPAADAKPAPKKAVKKVSEKKLRRKDRPIKKKPRSKP